MKKIYLSLVLVLINICIGLIVRAETNPRGNAMYQPETPNLTTLPQINGPSFVCLGQSGVNYSIDVQPGDINWNWSLPAGASIANGAGTNSITVNFGSTLGDICVSVDNGSGFQAPICKTIGIATARPATPAVINGPTNTVCPGQTITYSVPADPAASAYTWIVPNRMTLLSGAGTNTITVSVDSGFVWGYLRASAQNCRGTSAQMVVAVYSAPTKPGSVTGPSAGACPGGTYTYSFDPVPGATSYTWFAPAGCVITSPVASGNPLTTTVSTVDITFPSNFQNSSLFIVSNSGCNSSDQRELKIRSLPNKPGAIYGEFYGVCDKSALLYRIDSVKSATSYTWSMNPSNTSVIHDNGNDSITIDFLPGFTTATLCVTANNACGASISRCGLIYAAPRRPNPISGPIGACNTIPAAAIAFYSVDTVFGATGYVWSVPPGATIVDGQGTNEITVNYLGAASGQVRVTAQNDCGQGAAQSKNITVNACRMRADGTYELIDMISVYPNPAKDRVNVEVEAASGENYTINLVDITGRNLMSISRISVGNNIEILDLNGISKGVYMVEVHTKNNSDNRKLIID